MEYFAQKHATEFNMIVKRIQSTKVTGKVPQVMINVIFPTHTVSSCINCQLSFAKRCIFLEPKTAVIVERLTFIRGHLQGNHFPGQSITKTYIKMPHLKHFSFKKKGLKVLAHVIPLIIVF